MSIKKVQALLRGWFGFVAMAYGLSAITMTPKLFLQSSPQFTADFYQESLQLRIVAFALALVQRLIFAIPLVLTGVFGIAWWKLKLARPAARRWGLAASIAMLLSSVPMMPALWLMGRDGFRNSMTAIILLLIAGSLSSGVAGIVCFSKRRSESTIETPPPRISGDGTHKMLDALALILQVGGVIALMNVYTRWGNANGLPFAHGLNSWMQWAIVILIVTLIHESAHALVGIAVGMKLRAFVIGPFQWRVTANRWGFEFRPTQLLAFSGAAGLVPVDPDQNRWNEVVMIAAGPIANLLTGAVSAAFAYYAVGNPWWSYWEAFGLFATVSLVAGVVNLLPLRPDSLYSDGARIVQLFRQSPAADFNRVVQCVSSTLVSPRRPRDYDLAAIERAAAHFETGRQALLLRVWKCSCLLDRGDLVSASEALVQAERIYRESAIDIPPDLHTGFLIKGIALGRDRSYLRDWWHSMEAKKPDTFDQDYWLAKSVFHWANNDISSARDAWRAGHAYCEQLPDVGTYNYDRDRYVYVKRIFDNESNVVAADKSSNEPRKDPDLQPSLR